ncbi:hypothetical protein SDC9_197476 [bioreactor metagenome]|uniref:Uncharacterized protein n=1 Tax=bioreactor metagenome TaxID=1076179 RepID=A0A645IG85_9ZZZZ
MVIHDRFTVEGVSEISQSCRDAADRPCFGRQYQLITDAFFGTDSRYIDRDPYAKVQDS